MGRENKKMVLEKIQKQFWLIQHNVFLPKLGTKIFTLTVNIVTVEVD